MPPHGGPISSSSRSESGQDYHTATVVVGLIGLSFIFFAPVLWILWKMRTEKAETDDEETQQRQHISQAAQESQQNTPAAAVAHQRPLDDDVTLADTEQQGSNAQRQTRAAAFAAQVGRAIASSSRAAWPKVQKPPSAKSGPHGQRRSIELLPIAKYPAWRRLASGSITPSTTRSDVGKPAGTHIDDFDLVAEHTERVATHQEVGTQSNDEALVGRGEARQIARPEPQTQAREITIQLA